MVSKLLAMANNGRPSGQGSILLDMGKPWLSDVNMMGVFETFFWGTLGIAAAIGSILVLCALGVIVALWIWDWIN